MLTHDELSAAITAKYPDLIHGVDFWVGHEVDGDRQVSEARIYQWGVPEKYMHEVSPEQHVPEQDVLALIDEENPGNSRPASTIPAYTIPALIEERTRFNAKYPEPTAAELAQWVADNAEEYAFEQASKAIRAERNSLLIEADNMLRIAEDGGPGDVSALRTYRQALRDVPQKAGFPFDIEWPQLPA